MHIIIYILPIFKNGIGVMCVRYGFTKTHQRVWQFCLLFIDRVRTHITIRCGYIHTNILLFYKKFKKIVLIEHLTGGRRRAYQK